MNGELSGSARTVGVRSIEAPCPRPLGKRTQSCCSAADGTGGIGQWSSGDTDGHLELKVTELSDHMVRQGHRCQCLSV